MQPNSNASRIVILRAGSLAGRCIGCMQLGTRRIDESLSFVNLQHIHLVINDIPGPKFPGEVIRCLCFIPSLAREIHAAIKPTSTPRLILVPAEIVIVRTASSLGLPLAFDLHAHGHISQLNNIGTIGMIS